VIDFVATRQGTDPKAAACARLLTAVIAMSIRDACRPPNKAEKRGNPRVIDIDQEALSALRFLFARRSPFSLYCSLIGAGAEDIRRALIDPDKTRGNELKDKDFRILRARLTWSGLREDMWTA